MGAPLEEANIDEALASNQGDPLTHRCNGWTEELHRQRGWTPEAA